MIQYQGNRPDEGLDVEFYMGSILDPKSTKEAPVFMDIPFVRIKIPGNRDEIIDTEAWLDDMNENSHLRRFPNAWARFKAKEASGGPGFPLKEWAQVLKSQVDILAYHNVKTVEQLADVTEADVTKIPQGLELRTKARAFLSQRTSADTVRAELDELKAKFAAMAQASEGKFTEPKLTVLPPNAAAHVTGTQEEAQESTPTPVRRRRGRPSKSETTAT